VAARSKAWLCRCSIAGIVGSNRAGAMDCLSLVSVVCCQVDASAPADHSSREVLPILECLTECDLVAFIMRKFWPTRGCCAMVKKYHVLIFHLRKNVAGESESLKDLGVCLTPWVQTTSVQTQILCSIYDRFKIVALYEAACDLSVRGTPKRLVLFQILCEAYIYVNSYTVPFASAIYG